MTDDQMVAMYLKGATLAAVGERAGVTRERARQIMTKLGLNRPPHHDRIQRRLERDRAFVDALGRMTRLSTLEIARRTGMQQRRVHTVLARTGVIKPKPRVRRYTTLPDRLVKRIVKLRKAGKSQSEIAEALKLNLWTVAGRLKKLGMSAKVRAN